MTLFNQFRTTRKALADSVHPVCYPRILVDYSSRRGGRRPNPFRRVTLLSFATEIHQLPSRMDDKVTLRSKGVEPHNSVISKNWMLALSEPARVIAHSKTRANRFHVLSLVVQPGEFKSEVHDCQYYLAISGC